VPQFVQFGFDDNSISGAEGSGTTGGIRFVQELFAGKKNPEGQGRARTFDGAPARTSLYVVTRYIAAPDIDSPRFVRAAWRAMADAGHEIALHTHTHPHGAELSTAAWRNEIETCRRWLTTGPESDPASGLGLDVAEIVGFRTPYLEHGKPLFPALRDAGISYDCSIEEGFDPQFDAQNFYWPYAIDPSYGGRSSREDVLWEIPVYALIVPPDAECARYGVEPGLRDRLHAVRDYFNPADGKITGFDWNLWVEFGMKPEEVVATFRYTLDQRLHGNRAPLTFGAHSDLYSEQYPETLPTTAEQRREALLRIVDDALSRPEVRVVSARQLLDWIRDPAPLR
ncbi:MAG: polysaccharide deacetylase family protein, partial [Thermoanaerobaculia bacterium]